MKKYTLIIIFIHRLLSIHLGQYEPSNRPTFLNFIVVYFEESLSTSVFEQSGFQIPHRWKLGSSFGYLLPKLYDRWRYVNKTISLWKPASLLSNYLESGADSTLGTPANQHFRILYPGDLVWNSVPTFADIKSCQVGRVLKYYLPLTKASDLSF